MCRWGTREGGSSLSCVAGTSTWHRRRDLRRRKALLGARSLVGGGWVGGSAGGRVGGDGGGGGGGGGGSFGGAAFLGRHGFISPPEADADWSDWEAAAREMEDVINHAPSPQSEERNQLARRGPLAFPWRGLVGLGSVRVVVVAVAVVCLLTVDHCWLLLLMCL